jgi:hypothetical protein
MNASTATTIGSLYATNPGTPPIHWEVRYEAPEGVARQTVMADLSEPHAFMCCRPGDRLACGAVVRSITNITHLVERTPPAPMTGLTRPI